MKRLLILASALLSISVAHATTAKKVLKPSHTNSQANLGTSFKFDGTNLGGKFQSAMSTTSTVENDKFMDDLLGARKSFNDRNQKDDERN